MFNPEAVRQALPALSLEDPVSDQSEEIDHYRAFYSLEGFSQAGLQHRLGYFDAAGFRIAVQCFQPKQALSQETQADSSTSSSIKGTVWVVHGYTDHVGNFRHLIQALVDQGYWVMTYDLPGHGLSDGDQVAIQDFSQYRAVLLALYERFADQLPGPQYAIGQSTGAAILMDTLVSAPFSLETHALDKRPAPWQRVVLLAPLLRIPHWQRTRWLYRLLSPFKQRKKRQFRRNTSDAEFVRFLKDRDPLQAPYLSVQWVGAMFRWADRMERVQQHASETPVLVVQGERDRTVDFRYNLPYLEKVFAQLTLIKLPQASHQLVNESQDLRDQVFKAALGFLS